MKKLFLSLALLASFTSSAFALTCQETLGVWKGNLENLTNVRLFIHQPQGMEDAVISFKEANGTNIEYGMLKGGCVANPDGSVTLQFQRDSYGVVANLTANLVNDKELAISNFTYRDPHTSGVGSGVLNK